MVHLHEITLSNPISTQQHLQALRLQGDAPEGGYKIGDTVRVPKAEALALINSGYAQVDPEDKAAVQEALSHPVEASDEPTPEPEPTQQPGEQVSTRSEPAVE